MELDDRTLVSVFLDTRNEDVFRAIYRRHSPTMFGLACRLVGRRDAEDVVQETWIRAIRLLEGFAWASSLRTWLCGIAVNCCRERWRARSQPPSPEEAPITAHPERALELQSALDRLSPGYRAVVVLHDIYGYTHAEIGELLGIEAGTSKSQLARGRVALRVLLGVTPEGVKP